MLVAGIVGIVFVFAVVRNAASALFALITITVILTLRTRDAGMDGAPSTLDLILGIIVVSIIGYWIIRIRILERQTLSVSVGQLFFVLFIIWAAAVTVIGLQNEHNTFNEALREILNLLPLLIIPILYERFIEPGRSKKLPSLL